MKIIASIIGSLAIYLGLVVYLGWNVYVWMESWAQWIYPTLFSVVWLLIAFSFFIGRLGHRFLAFTIKIGRASCRERVEQSVVAAAGTTCTVETALSRLP